MSTGYTKLKPSIICTICNAISIWVIPMTKGSTNITASCFAIEFLFVIFLNQFSLVYRIYPYPRWPLRVV